MAWILEKFEFRRGYWDHYTKVLFWEINTFSNTKASKVPRPQDTKKEAALIGDSLDGPLGTKVPAYEKANESVYSNGGIAIHVLSRNWIVRLAKSEALSC